MTGFSEFSFLELHQLPAKLLFLPPCHLLSPYHPPGSLLLEEPTAALDRSFHIGTCDYISSTLCSPPGLLVLSEKIPGMLEYDVNRPVSTRHLSTSKEYANTDPHAC